jgi:hypothetical protein
MGTIQSKMICAIIRDPEMAALSPTLLDLVPVPVPCCEVCFSGLRFSAACFTIRITPVVAPRLRRDIMVCAQCVDAEATRILNMGIDIERDDRYGKTPLESIAAELAEKKNG